MVWVYSNELFRQLLFSIEEFCDGLREIVSSYHTELCVTTLLHDSTSHDWQNEKAFFEVLCAMTMDTLPTVWGPQTAAVHDCQ